MKAHPELITTAAEIIEVARALSKHDIIAFDTEFIRETTFFPKVEIIQLATSEDSWLVDAQAFQGAKGKEALRPLLDVFQDKKILKILHAAQGDQECIYTSFGVVATPTLDTAVAASLCGYGDSIGLGNLVKLVLDIKMKKGHARTNWSVRPLPPQLLEYAHADVEHLVELGKELLKELDELGRRDWALELSAKWENQALYEPDPDSIVLKLARGGRLDKSGFSALEELVKWRETRVRQLNLPRRWVADDNVLLDLAHVRPKDVNHLGTFRGLNKGELKNSGEAILGALRRSTEKKNVELPEFKRTEASSTQESRVLDLVKCYMGILADRHRIAARHLMTADQALPLLRQIIAGKATIRTTDDLVKSEILTEGAARLVGDEILALLQGKRALSVENGQVRIVEIP